MLEKVTLRDLLRSGLGQPDKGGGGGGGGGRGGGGGGERRTFILQILDKQDGKQFNKTALQ